MFLKYFYILFLILTINSLSALELSSQNIEELRPLLNSQRIELFFGPGNYGVELLPLNKQIYPNLRLSNLYSTHNGQKIMRTCAITLFSSPMDPLLFPAHNEILGGKSIGSTLSQHGWKVIKKIISIQSLNLDDYPWIKNLMQTRDNDSSALFAYELKAQKSEGEKMKYATLIEIYSPSYLTLTWLKALYPEDYDNHIGKELPFSIPKLESK